MHVLNEFCEYVVNKYQISNVKIINIYSAESAHVLWIYITMELESDNELIDHCLCTMEVNQLEDTENCLNTLQLKFDNWYTLYMNYVIGRFK